MIKIIIRKSQIFMQFCNSPELFYRSLFKVLRLYISFTSVYLLLFTRVYITT